MWLSTWPAHGIPQYAEHPTEQAAEAHAAQVVRAGAESATAFWLEGVEVAGTRATGARTGKRGEGAPESHDDGTGPTGADFERESA